MSTESSATMSRAVAAYISVITDVFGGEAWDLIELHAERAWAHCRVEGDPEWAEVRAQLQAVWPSPAEG